MADRLGLKSGPAWSTSSPHSPAVAWDDAQEVLDYGYPGGHMVIPAIPKPGPGGARPLRPVPKIPEAEKAPGAVYLLDAGVGFAFAHAQIFPQLVQHYAGQLHVIEVGEREWARRARGLHPAPRIGYGADGQAQHDARLEAAGLYLCGKGLSLPGVTRVPLPDEALDEIAQLQSDLSRLPPAQPQGGAQANAGECATIWLGRSLVGAGHRVVVLCADDDRARRMGARDGLNHRATPHILREMVTAGACSAEEAFDLFQVACEVSRPPADTVTAFSNVAAFRCDA